MKKGKFDEENFWTVGEWVETIVSDLLHCEQGIEYKIENLPVVKNTNQADIVLYYLEKIDLIKSTSDQYCLDPMDEDNDFTLYQFVLNRAPSFELIDENTFVVVNSPFYRALNNGQKALFYLLNNPSLKHPYRNVKIPAKYKTREFLDYTSVYFVDSWGPSFFTITKKGSDMILKINRLISKLCNYANEISLEEVIEQLLDQIPIERIKILDLVKLKMKKRRCKSCEALRALSFKEKKSGQEEYLSRFTSPESIVQEMSRLHNKFISVITNQEHLLFWSEVTNRYCRLLDKYHMEISTNPKNLSFESSLTEEACNGLTELGLLERRTESENSKKN